MHVVKREVKIVQMVQRCPIDDPKLPKNIDLEQCRLCHYNDGLTASNEILCSNVQKWEE